MKLNFLTTIILAFTFQFVYGQENIKEALNFRDIFETKELIKLKGNFDANHKKTLLDFYSHFINCDIAEEIILKNNGINISKENLVELIEDNINVWDKESLNLNYNELDSINKALNENNYENYKAELLEAYYGRYMYYDFFKLDNNNYMLLVNLASTGASNHCTLLSNYFYIKEDKFSSINLDGLLFNESALLSKNLNGKYHSSFTRHGTELTEINGKDYFTVFFSEEGDPGCCPSIVVAIPSWSNEGYNELDSYFIESEKLEDNKTIDWKVLKE